MEKQGSRLGAASIIRLAREGPDARSGGKAMSGKAEEVKGRAKKSAGIITGNEKLKNSGRADQASGKVKQAVTRGVDKIKNAVKKIKSAQKGN